jgi:hypothetical protein
VAGVTPPIDALAFERRVRPHGRRESDVPQGDTYSHVENLLARVNQHFLNSEERFKVVQEIQKEQAVIKAIVVSQDCKDDVQAIWRMLYFFVVCGAAVVVALLWQSKLLPLPTSWHEIALGLATIGGLWKLVALYIKKPAPKKPEVTAVDKVGETAGKKP